MKNIIITGGCGFIGKNLIIRLLSTQDINRIICIDNFSSSREDDFIKYMKKYNKDNKITLCTGDICDINFMNDVVRMITCEYHISNIDEIYHLASIASPVIYKQYPLETLNTGFIGMTNMLDLAKFYQSKILFSSTSEVYGDAEQSPQKETYYGNVNSYGCRSCYDESKRIGEALCYTYRHKYNLDIRIARIFNTYGPHMMIDDGRIITEVIKSLMNDTAVTIFGDGKQTRSICMVDDTVEMLIKLMDSDFMDPVNIGNDIEMSVNDIARTIENVYRNILNNDNIKLKIEHLPLTQNDPLQRKPDLTLNKEVLGEHKYVLIEDGIKKTIEYFLNIN
jgi:UDP-glucuronate decarboxylase